MSTPFKRFAVPSRIEVRITDLLVSKMTDLDLYHAHTQPTSRTQAKHGTKKIRSYDADVSELDIENMRLSAQLCRTNNEQVSQLIWNCVCVTFQVLLCRPILI